MLRKDEGEMDEGREERREMRVRRRLPERVGGELVM